MRRQRPANQSTFDFGAANPAEGFLVDLAS